MTSKKNALISLALLASFASLASAGPASTERFSGQLPVSDAQLAHLRGGFSIGHGPDRVKLDFGIDRLTFINGELKAVTSLTSPIKHGELNIIQNGVNQQVSDSVLRSLPQGTLGTVIQNNLDGQTISNLNVFNITVTTRQAAHALILQHAVTDALARTQP